MKKYIYLLAATLTMLILTSCHSHSFAPATCTTPSTCTECNETQGEALGHELIAATCERPATCSRCSITVGEALGHKWEPATCDTPKKCSVCGKKEGNSLGHDYSSASCTEPSSCQTCGKTVGKAMGHDYVYTNCTDKGVCSRCEDTTPALGHDYIEATCTMPKVCQRCATMEGEALGHDIVDGNCTRCDFSTGSLESLRSIANLRATCETDYAYCVVYADADPAKSNPYDVEYDYGATYDMYVDFCDWSLIYDHDYYVKTYPILAKLYHYNENLLLRHFQTVGIHEGRQASSSFSVAAYRDNCAGYVKDAFGEDYAPYAIYYLLNYATEKSVEHLKMANGSTPAKQQKVILTVMQAKELKEINNYRAEVDAQALTIDPELCAFANYRAWINAHDDWAAHDWAKQNNDAIWDILGTMQAGAVAENTVTVFRTLNSGAAKYSSYRNSKEHYEALIRTKYNYFGTSHFYNSKNENLNNDEWRSSYVSSTFDCFTDKAKTAYNK